MQAAQVGRVLLLKLTQLVSRIKRLYADKLLTYLGLGVAEYFHLGLVSLDAAFILRDLKI